MKNFRAEVEALRDEMIARRRDFHQNPELAFEEIRTAGIVAQTLTDLGLEVQTGVGKTGVVGILEGDKPGATVLVRCDMDALPIQEENNVPYRSQVNQKMHACGHDGHTAIALTVAKILNQHRADIQGRIKFVFQPAEEVGRGAAAMIADGVLSDPTPEVSVGLHLWNTLKVGEVAVIPGPSMAGSASFKVELQGKGGHGASPHQTIDPVIAAAHITTALQTIVSRNVDPLESAVISVTQISGGSAHNIIPDSAILIGTIRFFKQEVRNILVERFQAIIHGIATAMNCQVSVTIDDLTPPVVNDKIEVSRLMEVFSKVAPDLAYQDHGLTMGAEDMAFFLEKIPGVYFFVGSSSEGLNYPHHHPRFDFDEEALVIGATLLSSAVAEYVFTE